MKAKIRIALVINEKGEWSCAGWSGASDDGDMMGIALDGLGEGGAEARYWLTAEVDIPEEPQVAATVTAA